MHKKNCRQAYAAAVIIHKSNPDHYFLNQDAKKTYANNPLDNLQEKNRILFGINYFKK